MNVIIAGTRTFGNFEVFSEQCDRLLTGLKVDAVLCGECAGVDAMGKRWAQERGIQVLSYPAEWKRYGRAAGPMRNKQMAENADMLVAFWDGMSRGTLSMIKLMHGKTIEIIDVSGRKTEGEEK